MVAMKPHPSPSPTVHGTEYIEKLEIHILLVPQRLFSHRKEGNHIIS